MKKREILENMLHKLSIIKQILPSRKSNTLIINKLEVIDFDIKYIAKK